MRHRLIVGVLLLIAMSAAQADDTVSGDWATDMVVDVVVMRPWDWWPRCSARR